MTGDLINTELGKLTTRNAMIQLNSIATGYRCKLVRNRSFVAESLLLARVNPVYTAPGTDSMTCVAHYDTTRNVIFVGANLE